MSDEENYQAAIFFTKIARVEPDDKYKGIVFDFLNLLKLRNKLSMKRIASQPEFASLYEDPRWKALLIPL